VAIHLLEWHGLPGIAGLDPMIEQKNRIYFILQDLCI